MQFRLMYQHNDQNLSTLIDAAEIYVAAAGVLCFVDSEGDLLAAYAAHVWSQVRRATREDYREVR